MRKLFLAGVVVVLACGGSNSNNNNNGTPGLKTFSYGSPQAPTAAQQSAANNAQTQMQDAVSASVNGQIANASSLPYLTETLTGALGSLVATPGDPESPESRIGGAAALLGNRTGALQQGCYTFTSSSITYNNCTISSSAGSETINGSLTATSSSVTWNLTVTYNFSAGGATETGSFNWTGQITVTANTIVGQGRDTFSGHYTGNGTTFDYAYTAGFDANLTYETSPSYCITGGTLEIRRTVNSTSNAGATPITNKGIKITWTGCGAYTVQIGS
ncbi:MAG TPA: hypothetical protein VMH40_12830 [Myxococcaceae bacterium]|nr:hypothetical protein [Myxococcaceae bacterium]